MTNTDYTSITLAWTKPKPEDGGEAKGYMVEMRSSNNLKWTQCNTQPLRMTMYTVKGLEPKEMYFLRVRAVNDGGAGEAVALDTDIQAMPPMGKINHASTAVYVINPQVQITQLKSWVLYPQVG